MRARPLIVVLVSAVLVVATVVPSGLTVAAQAQALGTSSGFGIQVGITLLGQAPITVGPLAAANSTGPTSATIASATVPGVLTSGVLTTSATASADPDETDDTATASVSNVAIPLLAALGAVIAQQISATCTATSSGLIGMVTLTDATLGSLGVLATDPAPDTVIQIKIAGIDVATLTLDEQIHNGDGSLTVNAWHLHLLGGAVGALGTGDVIIGSVTCGAPGLGTGPPVAPPGLTETFGAPTVPVGGTTSLTFTVSNLFNVTSQLSGVGFTDTLPSGLTLATPAGESGACGGGTIAAPDGGTNISLSGATLGALTSCTFSVNVDGITAGSQVNTTSTISSNEGGAGSAATATLVVVAPPALAMSFGVSSVPLGGSTTLSFTVTNPNATVALTGVGFSDTLPSGLMVSTPNGIAGSCGGGTITATAGSSSVSLAGATLATSGSCTFVVNVTGTAAGTQVNTTGTVSSNEGGTGGMAMATLKVVAPPVIAKSFLPGDVALGGTSTLTFTLTNPAANADPENGVGFVDTFPSGMVVANPSGGASTCADGDITANPGSGSVTASTILIPVGGSCAINVNVVGNTAGALVNSVAVSSTNGGVGNTAMATLDVATPPSIAKSFGAAAIPVGGSTSLGFTIANPASAMAATGLGFTDTLPSGLVVSTPNGLTGSCGGGTITATAGSTSVSLSGATLGDSASCTFSVNVTGTTSGVKNNSVTVTSTDAGTGNTATASITVVAPPTLTKAFGAASAPFGGSTALSFTVSNPNATVALTGVGFTDTLPSGLVVSTPAGLSGGCGGGSITAAPGATSLSMSGASIGVSAGCTFGVNVTAISAGTKVNTTSEVTSSNGGTGNTATATVTVTKAPTTTTINVSPSNPGFGSPATFTATVVPSDPNGSGTNPTGTVSFYLNGALTPLAVVTLSAAGTAIFTTSGLAAGANTVSASYSGDTNFLPSTSTTSVTAPVACTTTLTGTSNLTGTLPALVLSSGATCVLDAQVNGSITVLKGASLDLEGSTVTGSVNATGSGDIRICATSASAVTVDGANGFVVVGDAKDGCATNTFAGSLTLLNDTHGVQAIDNIVKGAVTASGNSGAGPFPDDTAPNISGN